MSLRYFTLSFAVFFRVAAGEVHGQSWDLAKDFSLDNNPSGAWRFGWQEKPGGAFNCYDLLWGTQKESKIKGFFSPGWFGPVRAWCKTRLDAQHMADSLPRPGELYYPDHWVEANFEGEEVVRQAAGLPSYPDPFGFVGKNTSPAPFGSWGYFWEGSQVLLMPPGGRGRLARTVVRWISPMTGQIAVAARFSGERIQGDAGMHADVHLLDNSKSFFDGVLNGFAGRMALGFDDRVGPAPTLEWSGVLSVKTGEILDVSVGTGGNFDYSIFGIQNKQLLPGIGVELTISALPDPMTTARKWVETRFFGTKQANAGSPSVAKVGAGSSKAPFSFVYGGKSSTELLKAWKQEHRSRALDTERIERTIQFTDPETGLIVRCVGIEYQDFPTVEWTVFFKNSGSRDTPILERIQALDLELERASAGEFVLHRVIDHLLVDTRLAPGTVRRMVDPFPYFNLEWPGEGLIVGLSWSGQAAIEFARNESTGLRLLAGQELTHFTLHPDEEVRTPMIVLQFWSGERVQAQNVWRRWMIRHNMPKPGGRSLGPQRAASAAYQFGNMVNATEQNQKEFIRRYIEEGLKPDFWWMDAGWYPPNISKNGTQLWGLTGTWEPDKKRFPRGLRAVSDYAHSEGVKTIVWFQPERASPETWLYENHPEWLLGPNGGDKLLDFGDHAAWQWAVDHFSKLVEEEGVDIYRQDMNIGPVGFWRAHDANDRQGITEIRHVIGYLSYLDELQRRHPSLRLDHFRIDLETLRRAAPLILGIDFEPVGDQCHNYRLSSWIPWHGLCSRVIEPYTFRSMMCPAIVTGWDLRRKDLDYPLAHRLIQQWEQVSANYLGDFYPLTPYSLEDDKWMAWQFDRPERGEGIVQAFRRLDSKQKSMLFKLEGLDREAQYTVSNIDADKCSTFKGVQLIEHGLSVPIPKQPGAAIFIYKKL